MVTLCCDVQRHFVALVLQYLGTPWGRWHAGPSTGGVKGKKKLG